MLFGYIYWRFLFYKKLVYKRLYTIIRLLHIFVNFFDVLRFNLNNHFWNVLLLNNSGNRNRTCRSEGEKSSHLFSLKRGNCQE